MLYEDQSRMRCWIFVTARYGRTPIMMPLSSLTGTALKPYRRNIASACFIVAPSRRLMNAVSHQRLDRESADCRQGHILRSWRVGISCLVRPSGCRLSESNLAALASAEFQSNSGGLFTLARLGVKGGQISISSGALMMRAGSRSGMFGGTTQFRCAALLKVIKKRGAHAV